MSHDEIMYPKNIISYINNANDKEFLMIQENTYDISGYMFYELYTSLNLNVVEDNVCRYCRIYFYFLLGSLEPSNN